MRGSGRDDGALSVLGVLGTFVLDRIVGLPGRPGPTEDLGGLAYALSAVAACLPTGWRALPVARVGTDAADVVRTWLDDTGLDVSGMVEVSEPNNRVELRYHDRAHRTERLSGGVGPWPWEELAPHVARCDALLVNFISGREMSLETARRLRGRFEGMIHADLHSLLLGIAEDGTRVPRPLGDWRAWVGCFDSVQVNEAELDLLCGAMEVGGVGRAILDAGPWLLATTLGERGAVCWWAGDEGVEKSEIPAEPIAEGDPTGCGDVWGAAMFCNLLAGVSVERAAATANRLAGIALGQSGVAGLVERLGAPDR